MKLFSCHEATRLASDALERRLKPMERLRLRLHLMMCDMCRRCVAQFQLMHRLSSRIVDAQSRRLSERQRKRIAQALHDLQTRRPR